MTVQERMAKRLKDSKKARQMAKAFGPESAYTFLRNQGWSEEGASFVVFGE